MSFKNTLVKTMTKMYTKKLSEEEMIKLIYKNDSKIDRYNIVINESENTVRVELEKSTKGFFGSIIDKEIYKEISSYTGSIKNNNIVIERNM